MNDPLTQKTEHNTTPNPPQALSSSAAMSTTNTKHSYKLCVKRATRRTRTRRGRGKQQPHQKRRRTSIEGKCNNKSKKLSRKLQALKSLIPSNNGDIVKADQLFKETADYIVLLRTRVVVLQKLIEYYGNSTENDENNALLS